jgi:hypothetical protein
MHTDIDQWPGEGVLGAGGIERLQWGGDEWFGCGHGGSLFDRGASADPWVCGTGRPGRIRCSSARGPGRA